MGSKTKEIKRRGLEIELQLRRLFDLCDIQLRQSYLYVFQTHAQIVTLKWLVGAGSASRYCPQQSVLWYYQEEYKLHIIPCEFLTLHMDIHLGTLEVIQLLSDRGLHSMKIQGGGGGKLGVLKINFTERPPSNTLLNCYLILCLPRSPICMPVNLPGSPICTVIHTLFCSFIFLNEAITIVAGSHVLLIWL